MPYRSNLHAVRAQLEQAVDAGLIAAASVVETAVKRELINGYTSGAFVTGHNARSVGHSDPFWRGRARFILVGTSITDPAYPLYWERELGHYNIFTRKHERHEVWRPALLSTVAEQTDQFAQAFSRSFDGSAPAASEAAD